MAKSSTKEAFRNRKVIQYLLCMQVQSHLKTFLNVVRKKVVFWHIIRTFSEFWRRLKMLLEFLAHILKTVD